MELAGGGALSSLIAIVGCYSSPSQLLCKSLMVHRFPGSHSLGTLGGSLGTVRLRINYSPTASGEKLALTVDSIYKKGPFHNKPLSLPKGIN